ncbi:MAG: SCO family protein [Aquabacterium sp.]|nr:SCO family protein [Aquabacterium sp.]
MRCTTFASAALVLLAWCCAAWLTQGFQVWTAEGARRLEVAQSPAATPTAWLLGDGLSGQTLHSVLARPGRVTIVSFIYTRCPTVCLALGSSFAQLQAAVSSGSGAPPGSEDIQLLSISFDPAHDDASQLRRYAALWRADARHWRLATVPDAGALQRLLKAWQVLVIDDGQGGYDHNAALLVVDQHGRLVRIFDDDDSATALAFARALHQASRPQALM